IYRGEEMKTEKLPDVPKQEPGDFYYRHLKLPYQNGAALHTDPPFESDPTITEMIDISTDSEGQLGFVILRSDNSLEIFDVVTGQHVRVTHGKSKPRPKNAQRAAQA